MSKFGTTLSRLAALAAVAALSAPLTATPASAGTSIAEQIKHYAECLNWMLTDPAKHAAECGPGHEFFLPGPSSGTARPDECEAYQQGTAFTKPYDFDWARGAAVIKVDVIDCCYDNESCCYDSGRYENSYCCEIPSALKLPLGADAFVLEVQSECDVSYDLKSMDLLQLTI